MTDWSIAISKEWYGLRTALSLDGTATGYNNRSIKVESFPTVCSEQYYIHETRRHSLDVGTAIEWSRFLQIGDELDRCKRFKR